jgi:hypothetical protein
MRTDHWKRKSSIRTACTIVALASIPWAQSPSCPESSGNGYDVVPLAGLENETFVAVALNNAGRVAGTILPAAAGDPWSAFTWQDGSLTKRSFAGSIVSVGGLSESGLVVGTLRPIGGGTAEIFVWDSQANQVQLIPTAFEAIPQGINDARLIVGVDEKNLFGFALDATTGGVDVIAFGAVPAVGVGTGGAQAVGNAGVAVGAEVVFDTQQGWYVALPYRWTNSGGIDQLDVITGGFGGSAVDINAKGNVAGVVWDQFFIRNSAIWIAGGSTLVSLGSPPGYFVSDALALNVHDQVIVVAPNDFFGFTRGFVWESGVWTDLSCFAPPGLFVSRPLDINDFGEVLVELTDAGGLSIVDTVLLRPQSPFVQAQELVRLGTPPNPAALLPGVTSGPVLGSTWDPIIDHTSFMPTSILDFLFLAGGQANLPSPLGTVLCSAVIPFAFTSTPGSAFLVPIPADVSLAGAALCSQAGSADAVVTIALTNALDITLGAF